MEIRQRFSNSLSRMVDGITLFTSPVVNNIKLRVRVKKRGRVALLKSVSSLLQDKAELITENRKRVVIQHNNFIVLRDSFVFIVFSPQGTVNITGIRDLLDIPRAISTFSNLFNIPSALLSEPVIDNITASGTFNALIDLQALKRLINTPEENNGSIYSSASFNASYFPAAFCKTFSIGTISIFGSGKYNIIGAKCQKDVQTLYQAMAVHISQLLTTTVTDNQSVATVV